MKKFIPILALCLLALPALFSCGGKMGEKVPVSSVSLSATSLDLMEGDEVTLTATVNPVDASDKSVSWRSSDDRVATVSSGRVKAVSPGNATITATAGDRSATCSVKVGKRVIAVTSVTLDKKTLKLMVGETATLTATVKPDDATDKTVTWSSLDAKVATVKDGVVTAVKAGTAIIMANAGEKGDMCTVTVEDPFVAVTSIELDQTTLTLEEGESATLKATVKPDNATDKTVTWSTSDSKIATVDNGKVTAVKAGTAKITAKAGEKTVTCDVTVKAPVIAVTSVTLDKTTLSLPEGGSATLKATVKPDNATDKTVTWSTSDSKVATVKDGKVTAVKAGTAKITAKAGEKSASCTVTVTAATVAVTSVELDKTTMTLAVGESYTLTATVKPDNATDKTVTWSSSNTAVATVKDGKVTAVKAGTATITAKAGDKSATCAVTVTAATVAVTSIALDKTSLQLTEGESYTLTATVKPDNATNKTVTWSTSDSKVATVKDGKVTAVKAGTATITAKAGDKTATCSVTVNAATVAVTSVTLDKTTLSLKEGESATLKATVKPDNATDKTVTWSTSDSKVATVENGIVTAVKAGTAKITAKAGGKTAQCAVTVQDAPKPVIHLTPSSMAISGYVDGQSYVVKYSIENGDPSHDAVLQLSDTWFSIDSFDAYEVRFSAEMNRAQDTRTGTITFNYPGADPVDFTIEQYSYQYEYTVLTIDELTRNVPCTAGTYKIDYSITNPIEGYGFRFSLNPHSAGNWFTVKEENGVISFTVQENPQFESRTVELTIKYIAAMKARTIVITQEGQYAEPFFDFLDWTPGINNVVNAEGEDCQFYVQVHNQVPGIELQMSVDASWISDLHPTGEAYWYQFTASPNTTGSTRYGSITMTYGTLVETLTFMQDSL